MQTLDILLPASSQRPTPLAVNGRQLQLPPSATTADSPPFLPSMRLLPSSSPSISPLSQLISAIVVASLGPHRRVSCPHPYLRLASLTVKASLLPSFASLAIDESLALTIAFDLASLTVKAFLPSSLVSHPHHRPPSYTISRLDRRYTLHISPRR